MVENTSFVIDRYRTATMALGYYGDSVLNSSGDIGAAIVGFAIAARCRPVLSAALVIGLELWLAWWIRDGLLLNLVMLIRPSEAIKAWQTKVPH